MSRQFLDWQSWL